MNPNCSSNLKHIQKLKWTADDVLSSVYDSPMLYTFGDNGAD